MKKVAIVSPMLLPICDSCGGAVEQLILNIINQNETSNDPVEIELYTLYSSELKKYNNTKVISIRKNKFYLLVQKIINLFYKIFNINKRVDYIVFKTIKEIKKNKYDKVFIENRMGLYIEIYKKTQNKDNLIYHMHNDFDEVDKTKENYKFIEKTCLKILTVSDYIGNRLRGVKTSNKIYTYYNCVDFSKFLISRDDNKKISFLKKQYNLNSNLVIGYVGRITEEKGVLELIKAFKKYLINNKNSKLLIVGSSWFDNRKLTEFEKKLYDITNDIRENVVFTGYIDYNNIKFYYKLIDILVIPSKCNEAFGLVALEGMISNLKIISTTSGALKEVLKNYGTLVSVDNLEENILNSLNKLSKQNHELFQTKFSKNEKEKFSVDIYYSNFRKFVE